MDPEEYEQQLNDELDKIEKAINHLKKEKASKRGKTIKKLERELETTSITIEEFDIEISDLPRNQFVIFNNSLKQIQKRHKLIKQKLSNKKSTLSG